MTPCTLHINPDRILICLKICDKNSVAWQLLIGSTSLIFEKWILTTLMYILLYSGVQSQIVLCHRRTLINYQLSEVIIMQHFSDLRTIFYLPYCDPRTGSRSNYTEALIFWAFFKYYIGTVRRSLMVTVRVMVQITRSLCPTVRLGDGNGRENFGR